MQQIGDQPRNTSGVPVEQQAHQLGHRDAAQETGDAPAEKKCPQCFEKIAPEARKCRFCDSYLDHRRFINFSSTILSLVLAIISVSTVMLQVYSQQDFDWFARHNKYVAYFPGSVKGLQIGAPVDFRGVTIGQVTQIGVLYDQQNVSARIPVIFELDVGKIEVTGRDPAPAERLINAGLQAQLQYQNLLTGELFVNLDFHPDRPVRLMGGEQPYPQISAIPSEMEQLQESAGDVVVRLPELLDALSGLFIDLDQSLDQTGGDFSSIMGDAAEIVHDFRKLTPEIVAGTQAATDDLRRVAQMLEDVIQVNRDAIGSMIDEWTVTATAIRRLADQVDRSRAHDQPGNRVSR